MRIANNPEQVETRMTKFRFVAPFIVLMLVLTACPAGSADTSEPAGGGTDTSDAPEASGGGNGGGEADGSVSVLSLWGGSERDAFLEVLSAFQDETGITVQYETARDFTVVLSTRIPAGNPPDIAIVPRPGFMGDLVNEDAILPLSELGIDTDTILADYAPAWSDLGTVNDELYGLPVKANSKSTVWYDPSSFEEQGFEPPENWDGLLEITQQYKDAGETPWAVGAADSWTLTDWFENIYVRTAGQEMYEQLFGGDLPFTDPSVGEALNRMVEIINEENVAGGINGALGTTFVDGIGLAFGSSASAEMYFEGGFVGGIALGDVNPELVPGETIAFFDFPTFEGGAGDALVGGGDLAVAFNNDPDIAALMQFLASKEAADIWAATGAIVSPNPQTDQSVYTELGQAESEQVLNAEAFVFDGSDLLPGDLAESWGTTLQGIIESPDQIDSLLEDFEADAASEFGR